MLLRAPDDATTRHLEGVAEDIRGLLGAGIDLQELVAAVEPNAALIHARYRLGEATCESEGRGENLIEAHAQLRAAIVIDRIGLGLRLLTWTDRRPRNGPSAQRARTSGGVSSGT